MHFLFNEFKVQDSENATHVCLQGGKLRITESNVKKFISIYRNLLKNNEPLYLVERVSSIINFFIDIDAKQDENTTNIVKDVLQILPLKHVLYKCNKTNGYHILFPDVITTPDEAYSMIVSLKKKLIDVKLYNKEFINKCIDDTVYKSGLRMIGSYKPNTTRYYTENNISRLKIKKDEIESSFIRASYDVYKQTSKISKSIKCDESNMIISEIKTFNKIYDNIQIRSIKKIGNTISIATNSQFCMNINRNHNSHFIYFIITPKKILHQKCFCKCNTLEGRQHGLCSNFKSIGFPLSHKVYEYLQRIT